MANSKVANFLERLNNIESYYVHGEPIKSDETFRIYFRGVNGDYPTPFKPKIFRNKQWEEKDIYYGTIQKRPDQFANLSNLDILAKMQHFGIPTRLLDLTVNPLLALFMASGGWDINNKSSIEEQDSKEGHVYIVIAKKEKVLNYDSDKAMILSTLPKIMSNDVKKDFSRTINSLDDDFRITRDNCDNKSKGNPRIGHLISELIREKTDYLNCKIRVGDLKKWFIVKPKFSNERIRRQSGLFAIFGIDENPRIPIYGESDLGNIGKNDTTVIDVIIDNNEKKQIRQELKFLANITYATITEDIESVSKYYYTKLK